MIKTIRSKALLKLAEKNDASGLPDQFVSKIMRILEAINVATTPEDMNLPGFQNHKLKADLARFWGITVTRNWRVIYRIENGDTYDVDYTDYH